MDVRRAAFLVMILVGGSLLAISLLPLRSYTIPGGLVDSNNKSLVSFGSTQKGYDGSLMPIDTLISTTYVANQSLSQSLVGSVIVYAYQISPGTVLYLGLYVNGQFASSQKYVLSGAYQNPATMVTLSTDGVANFTGSDLDFTVSQFPLTTAISAGAHITVTAWVSSPVWVQVDPTGTNPSYQTSTAASYSPTSSISEVTPNIWTHSMSIGLESHAG